MAVVAIGLQRKQTTLHVAVEVGNYDISSLLLAAGTQLTLQDMVTARYLLIDAFFDHCTATQSC